MTYASWADGHEYLVRSVSWRERRPHLALVDVSTSARHAVSLTTTFLAFTVRPERYCIGRCVQTGTDDMALQECPGQRVVETGERCAECEAADEFRFIHHVHRGGYVPDALRSYIAQPHWVYIATFADGTSKVGTAAQGRKRERLDEQGAVRATYVAFAEDGHTVRVYEDSLTDELGLTQIKRRSAKVAALCRPRPAAEIEAKHRRDVEDARTVLAQSTADPDGVWQPPAEHGPFFTGAVNVEFAEYPHELGSGDHCLSVLGLVGGVALVIVNDDDGPFVVDLGALKGRRVVPGPVRSPESAVQMGLF